MKHLLLTLLFMILAVVLSAGGVGAQDTKVNITKKDCRRLVRHTASADVAYKPGVDVRGRKIAPADIRGSMPFKLPDVFEFNIDVDIRKYLGGPENDAAAASAAVIAAGKATAAATSVEAAATAAQTISTTAAADAVTASTAVTTAKTALDADPSNATLRAALNTAKTASETASASAATAASDATAIAAAAAKTRTAADSADSATLAADKASYTETAATEATTTASP